MKSPGIYFYAALLLSCIFIYSCENDIKEIQKLTSKKTAIEEAKSVQSYLSQDGKVKAKLTSPFMLRYLTDSTYVEFPRTLHVDFYNDSLKVESQLQAKYGRYLENENKVFLRDSVVVFNVAGDTLHCKELYWDQLQELFYTDKNVIILKPDQKIYGSGLRAKQDFKRMTIFEPKGFIMIPDSTYLGY